jgi:hypothetical protein
MIQMSGQTRRLSCASQSNMRHLSIQLIGVVLSRVRVTPEIDEHRKLFLVLYDIRAVFTLV